MTKKGGWDIGIYANSFYFGYPACRYAACSVVSTSIYEHALIHFLEKGKRKLNSKAKIRANMSRRYVLFCCIQF